MLVFNFMRLFTPRTINIDELIKSKADVNYCKTK